VKRRFAEWTSRSRSSGPKGPPAKSTP
jgi:hypothetical protein